MIRPQSVRSERNINLRIRIHWTSALTNRFKVDYFRGHKLRGSEEDLQLFQGLEPARQPKIDDFDPIAGFGEAEDVLRLK